MNFIYNFYHLFKFLSLNPALSWQIGNSLRFCCTNVTYPACTQYCVTNQPELLKIFKKHLPFSFRVSENARKPHSGRSAPSKLTRSLMASTQDTTGRQLLVRFLFFLA
jgi:hypothetical protein